MRLTKSYFFGLLLFLAPYLLFSFFTYKDYGITADEEVEIKSGNALVNYYLGKKNNTTNFVSKSLPERQLPENSIYLRVYPALLTIINHKGYFEWYHLINMLISTFLFVIFYTFLFIVFKSPALSLLGIVTLFFTPRILGDIPVNLKDIPFATLYLLSIFLIYYSSTKMRISRIVFIFMGLIFGLAWGTRIIGLSLFFVYWIYNIGTYKPKLFKDILIITGNAFVLFIISLLPLFLFMPYLRLHFPQSLINLVANGVSFEYWDRTFLFRGNFLTKYQRPALYLPIWLLITIPAYILIPFFLSFYTYFKTRRSVYFLGFTAIIINLAVYFAAKPVIYNGPRHFLFLFPIIALISVISFFDLLMIMKNKNRILMTSLFVIWLFGMAITARTIYLLHPYEYVYFNEFIGGLRGAAGKYEMDYWFSSNKEASEWLSQNVRGGSLPKVYSCSLDFSTRYFSKAKFDIVFKLSEADYTICTYEDDLQNMLTYPIVHTVDRMGIPLNIVRKVK